MDHRIGDERDDGAQVYSLLRDSDLKPTRYIKTFFNTGSEYQR